MDKQYEEEVVVLFKRMVEADRKQASGKMFDAWREIRHLSAHVAELPVRPLDQQERF
jgi:hypothetical protein